MRLNLFPIPKQFFISCLIWLLILIYETANFELPELPENQQLQMTMYVVFYNLVIYSIAMLCFALGFKFIRIIVLVFFITQSYGTFSYMMSSFHTIDLAIWFLHAMSVGLLFHPAVGKWVESAKYRT